MFDHYPDMNHDGEKNVEDAILFHSEMDAVEQADREHRHSCAGGSTSPSSQFGSSEWATEVILRLVFLGVPVGYLALIVCGILPINVVTAWFALVAITGFFRMLTM